MKLRGVEMADSKKGSLYRRFLRCVCYHSIPVTCYGRRCGLLLCWTQPVELSHLALRTEVQAKVS